MILSIDTYSEIIGISLIKDHKVIIDLSLSKSKPFSEILIKKIYEILEELQINKKLIKKIVVNKGPGSYTGLRVGIIVAKTLSYSLNIQLYGYTSLDVMAYKFRHFSGKIICGINAGKGEVYVKTYKSENFETEPISEIQLLKLEEFQKIIDEKKTLVVEKNLNLQIKNKVSILKNISVEGAFYSLKHNLVENPFKLEPIYIRSS
jgi:tRNA threonylcarbamoyladenosine biosynthesis protein TsaB